MLLSDQNKKDFIDSDYHQYFDIYLESDITDENNVQFVNFVLPLSKIAEFYDSTKIHKMLNNECNNVIFTSSDNNNIYKYECYQKVFFIRMDPFDSVLRMHFVPKKYDASNTKTGDNILVFKDNEESIDSSNFYCTPQYQRDSHKNTINLEYLKSNQETSNGFYKFDIKNRVKDFNKLQINLGYAYNNTRPSNYIKHYTGIIDESDQDGNITSSANFTEDNRTLIDLNGDNRCDYTNKIAKQYVDSNGIDWTKTIVKDGGFDNNHVPGIGENDSTSNYIEDPDNKYYLFRGDCWVINNNYESSAAITSTGTDNFTVTGTFRTKQDMIGIYWSSQDIFEHPYISYGNKSDYTNVTLDFDYEMTGCKDFSDGIISITIKLLSGYTFYFPMSRFITNGHVHIDFNNLKALEGWYYIDEQGNGATIPRDVIVSPNNIESIMFVLVPQNYTEENQYKIIENTDFVCQITNIEVTNGEICKEFVELDPHQYRLCEGYDDIYNLNPFRVAKEMRKLGYTEWVDLYVGASHFYEKSGEIGDTISTMEFNHSRTNKMVLDPEIPLNKAFTAWLDCYSRELKRNDVNNLIISISMENLQCPDSWKQRDANNNFALTGWIPSTFFYSPCCENAIEYMQSVSEACLDIIVENGMPPILQLGEAWWWWNENDKPNQPPCFYDDNTRYKYYEEFGEDLPQYTTSWEDDFDTNVMTWLNQQLVRYGNRMRDVVKKPKYTNGIYMALFFPPSVLDPDRVPLMMQKVNYITNAYSPSKVDVLQLEDYDWVIEDSMYHSDVYSIGQELGFTTDRLHYYGGFVQYPEDATRLWRLIKKSMEDAIEANFAEVFVWAGSQVRRDKRMLGYEDDYENINIYHKTLKYFNGDLYTEENGLYHYVTWDEEVE